MTSATPSKISGSTVAIAPPTAVMTPRDFTSSMISIIRHPWMLIPVRRQVGAPEAIEIDLFDILVEQRHL